MGQGSGAVGHFQVFREDPFRQQLIVFAACVRGSGSDILSRQDIGAAQTVGRENVRVLGGPPVSSDFFADAQQ